MRKDLWQWLIFPAFLLPAFGSAQTIVFVDAQSDCTADCGGSWATAWPDLQAAIASTENGEIWVADGTYYPGSQRESTFTLKKGVAVYGGFSGTENTREQRSVDQNRSILSGDIGVPGASDNVYHVLHAVDPDESVILDGFYIENGNADGTGNSLSGVGGGMLIESTSSPNNLQLTLRHLRFQQNSAVEGGGAIYLTHSQGLISGEINNCSFISNNTGGQGGAVYLSIEDGRNALVFQHNSFVQNTAQQDGGALFFNSSSVALSEVQISDCQFKNNQSRKLGGAVYDQAILGSTNRNWYLNCTFINNTTQNQGGAVYLRGSQQAGTNRSLFFNTLFDQNQSGTAGGALFITGIPPNNPFQLGVCLPTIINSTFYANTAADALGQAVYNQYAAPLIANSIFRGNGRQIIDEEARPAILNNIVQNGYLGSGLSMNNQDLDPLFLAPDAGNFKLSPRSPAIDQGDPSLIPEDSLDLDQDGDLTERLFFDFEQEERVFNSRPDLGIDEWNETTALIDSVNFLVQPQGCNSMPANCDGKIIPLINGGVGPFTFLWNDGNTDSVRTGLCTGEYQLTITDGNGAEFNFSLTLGSITVNRPLTLNIPSDTSACAGDSLTLNAGISGGAAPFEINWDNGAGTTADYTFLLDANRTVPVQVIDADGCMQESTVSVTQDFVFFPEIQGDTVFCENDGTTLEVGLFEQYQWSTGETTPTITVDTTGFYSVEVFKTPLCRGLDTIFVRANPSPVIGLENPYTYCSDGDVLIEVGDFASYNWTDGTNNLQGGKRLRVNTTGTYFLTVTNEFGCTGVDTATVFEQNEIPIEIIGDINLCPSGDGSIQTAERYDTYAWSNFETTQRISVQMPGVYSVSITTKEGCFGADTVEVFPRGVASFDIVGDEKFCKGDSTELSLSIEFDQYKWPNGDTTRSTFFDRTTRVTVQVIDSFGCVYSATKEIALIDPRAKISTDTVICGTDPLLLNTAERFQEYLWSTGETTQVIEVTEPGPISVRIVDRNGCVDSSSTTILAFDKPVLQIDTNFTICPQETLTLDAGLFTRYEWSTGDSTQIVEIDSAGIYSLAVFNEGGCVDSTKINIQQPPPFEVDIQGDSSFCEGSSLSLSSGLFARYQWSTGDTTQTISIEEPGTYRLTAFDALGCFGEDSIVVSSRELPALVIEGDTGICPDGATTLSSNLDFSSYLWSTGDTTKSIIVTTPGQVVLQVTNAEGCINTDTIVVSALDTAQALIQGDNILCPGATTVLDGGQFATYQWSTGEIESTILIDTAGEYRLTVTNLDGCRDSTAFTVSPGIIPEPDIQGATGLCPDESAFLTLDTFATYLWSTGDTTQILQIDTIGTYSVTVTNDQGCQNVDTLTITQNLVPVISITGATSFCAGRSTLLDGGNFTGYQWSTGATTRSVIIDQPGEIGLTVTNAEGCSSSTSVQITELALPSPVINGPATICPNASIQLTTGNFQSYDWSTGDTTATVTITQAGPINLTVTSFDGCTNDTSFTISQGTSPQPVIEGPGVVCPGESIALSSGSFSSYNWSTGDTSQTIQTNVAGTLTLMVTNAEGCAGSDTLVVLAGQAAVAQIFGEANFCPESNTILDGGDFVLYQWSTGDTSRTITVSQAGTVRLMVQNEDGCTGIDSITLNTFPSATPEITGTTTICPGETTELSSGPFASYLWSTNATTPSITVDQTGTYSLSVTTTEGCSGQTAITVEPVAPPQAQITAENQRICPDEQTLLFAAGGDSYEWIAPDGSLTLIDNMSAQVAPSNPSIYLLVATNRCGLTDTSSITIDIAPSPLLSLERSISVLEGDRVTLNVAGASRYSWTGPGLSCTSCPNPTVSPTITTTYAVSGFSQNGCVTTDSVTVNVIPAPESTIRPYNVFTPNNDGVNDVFLIDGIELYEEVKLTVLNRWGTTVYQSIDYQNDWDGRYKGQLLPAGNYLYILVIEFNGKQTVIKNTVTIIHE